MPSIDTHQFNKIAETLSGTGYCVVDKIFQTEFLDNLSERITSIPPGQLKAAAIGRGELKNTNVTIRSDSIYWLNKANKTDKHFLVCMEQLRLAINQALYLGLFDYEAHYATYQPGDFYNKHVDSLKGLSNRVLSTVLYLNKDWQPDNGGELVLYNAGDNDKVVKIIQPVFGRLVIFLSEKFPHEVRVANRQRYSIAGWFRVNASDSSRIDTQE